MCFGKDGSGGDRDAACVTFDEGFLLDEDIELHGVDQEVIRLGRELLKCGGHGLAAGLVDIPGIDARGVDFGDGPGDGVFADTRSKFGAAIGIELLGIVKADDAALRIENDCGGNNRAEERAAAGFINSGDARPAEFARRSLKTGRAETGHTDEILAWRRRRNSNSAQFVDRILNGVTR